MDSEFLLDVFTGLSVQYNPFKSVLTQVFMQLVY
jgi:hypothetical protein